MDLGLANGLYYRNEGSHLGNYFGVQNGNNFGIYNETLKVDLDAKLFINATKINNIVQKKAINKLVIDLKLNNLWSKIKVIYPFIGGNSYSHKFNLKNPIDSNDGYRLNFNGGWTHSNFGVKPDGVTGYADTFLPANQFYENNHISVYCRTQNVNTEVEIGNYNTGIPKVWQLRVANNYFSGSAAPPLFTGRVLFTTTTDARGFWLGTKISHNERLVYLNGINQSISTTFDNTIPSPINYYIGARNDDGIPFLFSTKELSFATIGQGLTNIDVYNLYIIVQNFQKTLGRQV